MGTDNTAKPIKWLPDYLDEIGYFDNAFAYSNFLSSISVKDMKGKLKQAVRELQKDRVADLVSSGTNSRRFGTVEKDSLEYALSLFDDGKSISALEWNEMDSKEQRAEKAFLAKTLIDAYNFKNEIAFKTALTTITNTQTVASADRLNTADKVIGIYTRYLDKLVNRDNLIAGVPRDVVAVLRDRFDFADMINYKNSINGSSLEEFIRDKVFANMVSKVVIFDTPDSNKDSIGNVWTGDKNIYIQHKSPNVSIRNRDGMNHLTWSKWKSGNTPYVLMDKTTADHSIDRAMGEYKIWMDSSYGFLVKNPKNILVLEGVIA